MGRRSEQRIAISISVVVRGTDSRGNAYAVHAETSDISISGACLHWPAGAATLPAGKIEIEHGGKRAWFQIRWVGKPGTARSGRVGARCLEPSKSIWELPPKEWEPDTYDVASTHFRISGSLSMSTKDSWQGKERRQFPRKLCAISAELTAEGYSVGIPVKIADISLGGCYIEMFSPLPRNSLVELSLKLDNTTLQVSGKVRSSQTGFGMGIAFTSMSPEHFEKLKTFAPASPNVPAFHTSRAVSPAPPAVSLSSAPSEFHLEHSSMTPAALEAIVRVLCRKGLLTTEELLAEIEKLKVPKV